MMTLANLMTLCAGGPIAEHVRVFMTDALVDAVIVAGAVGGPPLVVGGGSNLLASDVPFKGTVVDAWPPDEVVSIVYGDPTGLVVVHVGAGTIWGALVSWMLSEGLCGLEALSGISGTVGTLPVQNVDTYGYEVSETTEGVETYDRLTGIVVRLFPSDLGFAHRSSAVKRSVDKPGLGSRPWGPASRWVVLSVDFRLVRLLLSIPVMYTELARRLGIEAGERADASLVRSTVLDLRRGKDMALDAEDHDTWSVGSFFTNPILPEVVAAPLPEGASRFSAGEGLFETGVAWLVNHAGRGKSLHLSKAGDPSRTSLSTKHVLTLTNHGGTTGTDIEAPAHAVHERVFDASGVILVPESATVGITW